MKNLKEQQKIYIIRGVLKMMIEQGQETSLEIILKKDFYEVLNGLRSEYTLKMNENKNSVYYYQYQSRILALNELETKLYNKKYRK